MSILAVPKAVPKVMVFDWHATLADTMDAMYYALDEVLPKLEALGLMGRLLTPEDSKTLEDAKLVKYVRQHRELHPKIKADRKISRTDIFEVLFGADDEAKRIAHAAFDDSYRHHFGRVKPYEPNVKAMLEAFKASHLKLGVLTNRNREFMRHELEIVDDEGWSHLFDAVVCGDDIERRKPAPDPILKVLDELDVKPGPDTWYVGDSTTDVVAAKEAGVTSIFYNGAGWDREWVAKIFPGTTRHPHQPDAVVDHFSELMRLVACFR